MNVLLVVNYKRSDAIEAAQAIESFFENNGHDVTWLHDTTKSYAIHQDLDPYDFDLCISLGGDGTLLRAAKIIRYSQVPILGLSFGHLGFLCNPSESYFETLMQVLADEMHLSHRATLDVEVIKEEEDGSLESDHYFALNEVALSRGPFGDMVQFSVDVSGTKIDEIRGDGFVVSTATGSTGYALSCGGPFVAPEYKGLVCVPIAPHTILARAFMTSPSDLVEICCSPDRPVEKSVFVDGKLVASGHNVKKIIVKRGQGDVLLYDKGLESFYESVSRVFWGKGKVYHD